MDVKILDQMYEGKAKQVFATSDPAIVMVHYKDDATWAARPTPTRKS